MDKQRFQGFSTRAVHLGQEPDAQTGALSVPIYPTSAFAMNGIDEPRGDYEYSRVSNPTRTALESSLASLERGAACSVFASGMAAIDAFSQAVHTGEHILCGDNFYGGAMRLFLKLLPQRGVELSYVDMTDLAAVEAAIQPNTRFLYIESPTNPLMQVLDVAALAELAHSRGCELAIDNTFATPYNQNPIVLGADVVLHSTTKYINGHSDSMGGAVISAELAKHQRFSFVQKAAGAILSPFECWLTLRGVKTLALRMQRHEENGRIVADFLSHDKRIDQLRYPGLINHPQHDLAKRQMRGFGGMMSFETGSRAKADAILRRCKLFAIGSSLGAVESLIAHPATMSHGFMSPSKKREIGISDGLVRISVGVEDVEDILADLDQALG